MKTCLGKAEFLDYTFLVRLKVFLCYLLMLTVTAESLETIFAFFERFLLLISYIKIMSPFSWSLKLFLHQIYWGHCEFNLNAFVKFWKVLILYLLFKLFCKKVLKKWIAISNLFLIIVNCISVSYDFSISSPLTFFLSLFKFYVSMKYLKCIFSAYLLFY